MVYIVALFTQIELSHQYYSITIYKMLRVGPLWGRGGLADLGTSIRACAVGGGGRVLPEGRRPDGYRAGGVRQAFVVARIIT